ncbi:hypothetical protein E8E78_25750 [Pseudomonas sp. BN505]|nr:hypothetical protein [Pseudomonas sp. BN605]MDH4859957.1 hypothetical protein [Pseudomonas sp. BN505]NTY94458.1 hypothetical protein [Pseudomonas putida]NTZ01947.1 hypothetical protein [Pseudomonas putida]NTZ23897.1 hypothetical protein [Pseudomonas putida]
MARSLRCSPAKADRKHEGAALRPVRGTRPLLQVLRRFYILRNTCRSGLVPRTGCEAAPSVFHLKQITSASHLQH